MVNFILFNVLIVFLMTIDYILVSRNDTASVSLKLSVFWIISGLLFSFYFYFTQDFELMLQYLSGYFIEKSLSIDNIFVFFLIFSNFNIEKKYQHKILFVGIFTALVLRCFMIFFVGELIHKFHFVVDIFGALLVYAGIKSFIKNEDSESLQFLNLANKFGLNYAKEHRGNFFVKENNRWKPTVLIIVMIIVEVSDIVFAFDSIPAIFSITEDKTIIYSSNAFAIIGLRSLYGVFAVMVKEIQYLKYGIGLILCFTGMKMIFADIIDISAGVSLLIIMSILIFSVILSEYCNGKNK